MDATLAGEGVEPDGGDVEQNGNHQETKQLQPEAADVPVVNHGCGQVVSNEGNTCSDVSSATLIHCQSFYCLQIFCLR